MDAMPADARQVLSARDEGPATGAPLVGPVGLPVAQAPSAGGGAGDAPAQLDLAFARAADGRTVLVRRRAGYPYSITAPLADGEARARLIVQSASGGLYGRESLVQRIHASADADVLLRFPAATVVHAARDARPTRQDVSLVATRGARLRYQPRPQILFPGAHLEQSMRVSVADDARVLLCDGFMLHDPPGSGAAPRLLVSHLLVTDEAGRRIAMDRVRADCAAIDAALPGAAGGYRAFGSVWALGPLDAQAALRCRQRVAAMFPEGCGVRAAASALARERGMVLRIAARDGGLLDAALERVAGEPGLLPGF
jgi:urease accessory protein